MAGKGGKRAGAGRKSKAEELGLKALLDQCVTEADRKELFQTLVRQGKRGDVKAAALVLSYVYGKPKEQVEHSGELQHTHTVARVPPKLDKKQWPQSSNK